MKAPTIARVTYKCQLELCESRRSGFQAYQLWYCGGIWRCRPCVETYGERPVRLPRLDAVLEENRKRAKSWLGLRRKDYP